MDSAGVVDRTSNSRFTVRILLMEVRILLLEVRILLLDVRILLLDVQILLLDVRILLLEVRILLLDVRSIGHLFIPCCLRSAWLSLVVDIDKQYLMYRCFEVNEGQRLTWILCYQVSNHLNVFTNAGFVRVLGLCVCWVCACAGCCVTFLRIRNTHSVYTYASAYAHDVCACVFVYLREFTLSS